MLVSSNQKTDGLRSSPRDLVMRINALPKGTIAHRLGFEPGSPDNETTALPTELSRLLTKMTKYFWLHIFEGSKE